MRVAVFVEFFPPSLGSDRRIFEIMTRLSKKHEIHFLVFPPFRMLMGDASSPQDRFHFQRKEVILKQHGIIAHYLPVSSALFRLWKKSYVLAYFLTMLSIFFRAFRSTKKIDPQTIVLNYPSVYTGILGLMIGKGLLRKYVLLDFNDLIAQYTSYLLGLDLHGVLAKLLVFYQNFIVRNSSKIVAPTNYIKEYARRLSVPNEKIEVISNGVDTKYFDPEKYMIDLVRSRLGIENKMVCIYCGRLDSWAGTSVILQLSKESVKNPNLSFVVVGSGTAEGSFPTKNIICSGQVPYRKVPEMLAAAEVVLVPFPDNEVSRAASPLKLFEGMAMGKPVVASRVNGIEEVISNRKNGVLVSPNDIAEWMKAITELLDNRSLARSIGENARRIAKEKYDWELLSREYEKTLKE
jgi:glycosyltransferase involved in cell wall biosynthesis